MSTMMKVICRNAGNLAVRREPPGRERIVTDALCAAEGAYSTASAAVRDLASFAT